LKTRLFLGVGLILVLILTAMSFTGCSSKVAAAEIAPVNVNVNGQQGIWVNGTGKVNVSPDIATLSLGVSTRAAKVAEAQAQAAAAMDKVLAALTGNGIDKQDIQTQYFNIQQYTSNVPMAVESYPAGEGKNLAVPMPALPSPTTTEQYTGYEVSNMLTIKIRAIDKLGPIIDAAVTAGGDNIRMNGLYFSVDQPNKYYTQVRNLAIYEAKLKAQNLADLSGVTLGKVTYVSENINSQPMPYRMPMYKSMDMAGSASGTAISPGQTEVSLDVQVNYAIQ
jgi:uncharacterized protein